MINDIEPFQMDSMFGSYFKIDLKGGTHSTQTIIMCKSGGKPFEFEICEHNLLDLHDWLKRALGEE